MFFLLSGPSIGCWHISINLISKKNVHMNQNTFFEFNLRFSQLQILEFCQIQRLHSVYRVYWLVILYSYVQNIVQYFKDPPHQTLIKDLCPQG